MSAEAIARAARAATAAGHNGLAVVLFETLMARDSAAAAAALYADQSLAAIVLADVSVAAEVLGLWQAAEDTTRELEARWPEVQELMVGVASTHQQVQAAAAEIATSSVTAAVQAAQPVLVEAAREPDAVIATTAGVVAAVGHVAPLAQESAAAAAVGMAATAAAVPHRRQKLTAESAARNADAGNTAPEMLPYKRMRVLGCDRSD